MRTLSLLTSVFLALLCGTGCGSDDGKAGGGGGGECDPIDVCDAISIEHVNTICGLATSTYSLTQRPTDDPSQLPTVSGCDYDGSAAAQIEHDCFSSADLASYYYSNEKENPPGGEMQIDVTGVGDDAFLREDLVLPTSTTLYVLEANLIVVVTTGWAGGGETTARQCSETLAGEALAL